MKYILSLLIICFSLSISAQVDRSKAPKSGPAPHVNIGEYKSFTMPNGLKVLVVENNKIPKISFSLNVVRDPFVEGSKSGYTEFVGELWGKATNKRNAKQLSEEVDFIGAQLGTSSTNLSVSGLSKYSNQLMELFSDVLLNPAFPQDEFDKIVLQTKTALQANQSDPGSILNNMSNVTMFGANHPYGDVITTETVGNITLDDCKNYYRNFIHPNNSILVIVGDITLDQAKALVNKYLSKWQKGTVPTHKYDTPQEPQGRKVVFSNKDAATQASIAVSYPINYKQGAPDVMAVTVMNQILGGGGFQAKLFKNLRETRGYTYGAYSQLKPNELDGAGTFKAYAEVKANVVDSSLIETLKEMQNMVNADFSQGDVDQVKKTMAGNFSRSLESPSTIANFAYSIERFNLPKDFYTTYLERLDKVSKEDVAAAAKKYINPDNAYLFVVTDKSLKSKLTSLSTDGTVTELDYKGEPVKESPKVAANITADKIIDTYLEAIGGKAKLSEIKDMTVISEMAMQGMTITNTYKYVIDPANPTFMMEVSMMGNVMQKIIFDGEKAIISGPQGNQTIEGEKAAALKEQAYPILELEYTRLGIKPTVEGIEKVNGRDTYKLKVAMGDAITYSFYDVENGLKVRSVGTQEGVTQDVSFEDYHKTDFGINYPFLSKTSMQGMPIEMKVKEVKVNTGLKSSDFK